MTTQKKYELLKDDKINHNTANNRIRNNGDNIMFRKILYSPTLWLGMLILNAISYLQSNHILMIILSIFGIFSSAYLYEKYKTSRIIVILEKENERN